MKLRMFSLFLLLALSFQAITPASGKTQVNQAGSSIFLPAVFNKSNPLLGQTVINAPYYQVADVANDRFAQMGIFWYGKVRADVSSRYNQLNYSDVRIGYNDSALYVHVSTIDKWLWYNANSNGSGLDQWDGVTLLLDLNGSTQNNRPGAQSFRFVSQLRHWQEPANYQAAYRGNGTQWAQQGIPFTIRSNWRGANLNDNDADPQQSTGIDHGWLMTYIIPFSSLGLQGRPADGTFWRMALLTHDRDTLEGPPLVDQRWPEDGERDNPSSWANLRFGNPAFTPPSVRNPRTTTIYDGLNGAVVKDTAAGGGFVCGMDNSDVWSQWGERNFGGLDKFAIQNQFDVSDWPCFSKYYVTFPLSQVPAGMVIRSAKLVLHLFGGSDPANAQNSVVHVARVGTEWDEFTLNWNNAPGVMENDLRAWVNVYRKNPIVWPGDRYEWDVSRIAAMAYEERTPLRLALYSGDWSMHSGKYFTSSDADEWLAAMGGRPTLIVEWGDP